MCEKRAEGTNRATNKCIVGEKDVEKDAKLPQQRIGKEYIKRTI